MQLEQGHALIIGVGADLPNTIDDARGLADILKNQERCAYPPEQVQLLTGSAATRDGVLAALDTLAQSSDEESTVVIYFSGHGYLVSTPVDDVCFLMPHGYDLNQLKTTAIKDTEFTDKLRAIPAKKLLVLLDCCHAGGVGEAKAPYIEALAKVPLPPEAVKLLSEGTGRVLIASSQEGELSYAGKPYSAFTLALIEALSGIGVAKKDGYTRVADVALHARQVVPGRTKNRQHPILHFEHADNFVLAYYAGGGKEPKGLPFDVEPETEPELGARPGERFDQQNQTGYGSQTNSGGEVQGPMLSGQFNGPTAVGGGDAVDLRGSQGTVYKPSGLVSQHWGDNVHIEADVTVDQFHNLLKNLLEVVQTSGLDSETKEIVENDLQAVCAQTIKDKPNTALILSRLSGVLAVLGTADGVWGLAERIRPIAEQALQWARMLFK